MGCKSCGAQNIGGIFGTCLRCSITAAVSSALFWILYSLSVSYSLPGIVQWCLAGFAALVTLLLVGHVAGYMTTRRVDVNKTTEGD